MKILKNKTNKFILIIILLITLLGIPVFLYSTQTKQHINSQAQASTTLILNPASSAQNPLNLNKDEKLNLDVIIDPGINLPSMVRLEFEFDPSKLKLDNSSFKKDPAIFPVTLEEPILENNKLSISLSVGSDYTKAIQNKTKIGTLTVVGINTTSSNSTTINFGANTMVLSVAKSDYATQNVLSTVIPAYIRISSNDLSTPPLPLLSPSPIFISPTLIPTTPLIGTLFELTVYQHGIGNSGDNTNPDQTSLSNKDPKRPVINVAMEVYNTENNLIGQGIGILTYNKNEGNYKGSVGISNFLQAGSYYIKIKTDYHLKRQASSIIQIKDGQTNIISNISLVTGNSNNDNMLSILDYNMLLDCYSDLKSAIACNGNKKTAADFNDDAFVNQIDYNLFLREIATQPGQ